MKKLAIVGVFYDGYYDLWEDFLELFFKNWPDCPYPLFIVDSEKDIQFDKSYNVSVVKAGKNAEYSKKIQTALTTLPFDYYLLLLEDFFISKPVNTKLIEEVIKIIIEKGIDYYVMPCPEFNNLQFSRFHSDKEYLFVKKFDKRIEYTVSCQPAVWSKEFLSECIGTENYNAWIFEGMYAKSKTAHSDEFINKLRMDNRNILNIRHGAVQGKILPSVYRDLSREGYSFKSTRDILNKRKFYMHRIKQCAKTIMPLWVQKSIKKKGILRNSVTGKYVDEIQMMMKKMNLE